jgi:hypothetical protein
LFAKLYFPHFLILKIKRFYTEMGIWIGGGERKAFGKVENP